MLILLNYINIYNYIKIMTMNIVIDLLIIKLSLIYIYISVHSRATQIPKLGSALIWWVAALNI